MATNMCQLLRIIQITACNGSAVHGNADFVYYVYYYFFQLHFEYRDYLVCEYTKLSMKCVSNSFCLIVRLIYMYINKENIILDSVLKV